MSRVAAGAILGLVFVVTLLATVPARLLGSFIPEQQLVLQGYSGTLWRGTANRALLATAPGYIHLGQLRWSLSPLSLLTFSPSVHLQSNWGKQTIDTDVRLLGPQSIELNNLNALFSVKLLRQFLPVAVEGDVSAQFAQLRVENGLPVAARGRIVWQGAAWESSRGIMPLGTYALELQQDSDGTLRGDIITVSGEVNASGSLGLKGREYSLDILISAETGVNEQLQQALSLIAQAVPQGSRIKFDGQLSSE